MKRKRTSSGRDASAPRKRGPGRRAGPPKWLPEAPPAPSRKTAKPAAAPRFNDPHAAREATRYERPIPSREALLEFLEKHGQLMKAEAIADALGLKSPPDFDALTKRLAATRFGSEAANARPGSPREKFVRHEHWLQTIGR